MTAPNALEMTARLAEAIIASYELDETLAADLQRYRDIAAACREVETVTKERDDLKTANSLLHESLDRITAACFDVCSDNVASVVGEDATDDELGPFVILGDGGDPVLDADSPEEVIQRLYMLWQCVSDAMQKAARDSDVLRADLATSRAALEDVRRDNARLRKALEDVARHWNDDLPVFEHTHQLYAAATVAQEALAQEAEADQGIAEVPRRHGIQAGHALRLRARGGAIMTPPDSSRALVARLADALVASYELDESVTADIARYKAIAAAAREPATDGLLTQQREGQGAEEHMATGSLRGAPPAPAPSRDDDVEKTRAAIVEIVLTQLTTLGRMKDTDGWAATGHHLALLLDDALRPLAARIAQQDEELEKVRSWAERAERILASNGMDGSYWLLQEIAALAKGGA